MLDDLRKNQAGADLLDSGTFTFVRLSFDADTLLRQAVGPHSATPADFTAARARIVIFLSSASSMDIPFSPSDASNLPPPTLHFFRSFSSMPNHEQDYTGTTRHAWRSNHRRLEKGHIPVFSVGRAEMLHEAALLVLERSHGDVEGFTDEEMVWVDRLLNQVRHFSFWSSPLQADLGSRLTCRFFCRPCRRSSTTTASFSPTTSARRCFSSPSSVSYLLPRAELLNHYPPSSREVEAWKEQHYGESEESDFREWMLEVLFPGGKDGRGLLQIKFVRGFSSSLSYRTAPL